MFILEETGSRENRGNEIGKKRRNERRKTDREREREKEKREVRLFPEELDEVFCDTFRCLGLPPGYLDVLSTSADLAVPDLDVIAICPALFPLFTSQSVGPRLPSTSAID